MANAKTELVQLQTQSKLIKEEVDVEEIAEVVIGILSGAARDRADARGIRQALVSLSHDGDYAIAVVVATD
ncbi:MAG: hypothetical protein HC936_19005 [Leptolyngbyaceae cyanobacterium SU_3_3]|nr:hypothetical protein [Leptolyngbyaceae cyanobacterium SU_3_3]